ncbi:MAG: hydrogenase maturation nickel metallochaperone HypA [Collinsella sp.]
MSSVTLELGEVPGIIPSYLTDCWNWARSKNDLMRGAELGHRVRFRRSLPCEAAGRPMGRSSTAARAPTAEASGHILLQGNETTIGEIATPDEGLGWRRGGADDVRAWTRGRGACEPAPAPSESADAAPVC